MRGLLWTALLASCLVVVGCDSKTPETDARKGDVGVERLQSADSEPGNWYTMGRDSGESHYSPLDKINVDNVSELGFAWEYSTGTQRGLEATPIIIDGVLYTTGNWGVVYAVNAKNGEELWSFDPEVPGQWARKACCDIISRGLAVWEGVIYSASLDGRLFALDAATGAVAWEVDTLTDRSRDYTITGAPRIAGDNVVIGNGGAEYGVRGYVTAFNRKTGKQAWRFYTVPGDPKKPFEHPELEMASKTWDPDSRWDVGGGGTAWDSMVWDPELNILYVGTGNGAPWARSERSPKGGDNLFLSSILALDPATGKLLWHYQTTPGENWDYTSTQHMILTDLEIDGTNRKVLMQAPKNGFFYVLDRKTGELLSAEKYATATWASSVDIATGRPVVNPDAFYDDTPKVILPGPGGGHNWQPMSYSPDTGLVYIPYFDDPTLFTKREDYEFVLGWNNQSVTFGSVEPGTPTSGDGAVTLDPDEAGGILVGWDPREQRAVWRRYLGRGVFHGGTLSTGGNIVFQANDTGNMVAYNAQTGEVLKKIQTGNSIIAAPATYTIDGEQYIVVMAGYGGALLGYYPLGSAVSKYQNDGRILAFKLGGGDVPLPPAQDQPRAIPELTAPDVSETVLLEGGRMFQKACGECHINTFGGYPDLRRMTLDTHEMFNDIVMGGLLAPRGMASFADTMSNEQAQAIHAYLIDLAIKTKQEEESH